MTEPRNGGIGTSQDSANRGLTVVYLPVALAITLVISGLFSFAFNLGFTPLQVTLGLFIVLVAGTAALTGQFRWSTQVGTRLLLAHMSLVCLLGGVAAAPPGEFPELMLWSLAAMAAAAACTIFIEVWIAEKIDAAGPFSRRLNREAAGVLILALTLLLWRGGKVDGWVIAAGAIHYARLILLLLLPALDRVAALNWQPYLRFAAIIVLAAALTPIAPAGLAAGFAAASITAALVDIAVDLDKARS